MAQIICHLQCLPLPLPAQVMKMGQKFVQEILRKVVITLTSLTLGQIIGCFILILHPDSWYCLFVAQVANL